MCWNRRRGCPAHTIASSFPRENIDRCGNIVSLDVRRWRIVLVAGGQVREIAFGQSLGSKIDVEVVPGASGHAY
jgi:hypothetical protein